MLNHHVDAAIKEQENGRASVDCSDVMTNPTPHIFEWDAFLILMDSPSFQRELALETHAKNHSINFKILRGHPE